MARATRILLIDDDPIFTHMATDICERSGATVTSTNRIHEAERLMTEQRFDLAIVDGLLPDGSGMDFIKRRRHGGDFTPIVFCSAFWKDRASHISLKQAWGVHAVLMKPFRQESDLLDAVTPFFPAV